MSHFTFPGYFSRSKNKSTFCSFLLHLLDFCFNAKVFMTHEAVDTITIEWNHWDKWFFRWNSYTPSLKSRLTPGMTFQSMTMTMQGGGLFYPAALFLSSHSANLWAREPVVPVLENSVLGLSSGGVFEKASLADWGREITGNVWGFLGGILKILAQLNFNRS